MKFFIDGDQIVLTKDDFVDLQTSFAVFIDSESVAGETIVNSGIISLSVGDLVSIKELLDTGGGIWPAPGPVTRPQRT